LPEPPTEVAVPTCFRNCAYSALVIKDGLWSKSAYSCCDLMKSGEIIKFTDNFRLRGDNLSY